MAHPEYRLDITVYTPDLERENFADTIKKLGLVSLTSEYYTTVDCSADEEAHQYVTSRKATNDVYVEAKCSCEQKHHIEWWHGSDPRRIYKLANIIADFEQWDGERREKLKNLGYFI